MRSEFSIMGHPIHPMLVVVPIGLFIWVLVADVIYLATDRDRMWYDIAFWTSIGAMISALIAAIPGLGDYVTIARHSDSRGMATAHMVLNIIVLALFAVAAIMMFDGGALEGGALGAVIALHAVGVGLLAISGWLGGEMVYRNHLAMIPDTGELAADEERRHAREEGRAAS